MHHFDLVVVLCCGEGWAFLKIKERFEGDALEIEPS
jgi:hypothetical protein